MCHLLGRPCSRYSWTISLRVPSYTYKVPTYSRVPRDVRVDSLIHFLIRRRWCELRMRVTARSTAANDQVHPLTNRAMCVCYGTYCFLLTFTWTLQNCRSFEYYIDARRTHAHAHTHVSIYVRLHPVGISYCYYTTMLLHLRFDSDDNK